MPVQLPQDNFDASTASSQPPTPQRCVLDSVTSALSTTQLAVMSLHKEIEDLKDSLHTRTQELDAVKAKYSKFKATVKKVLAQLCSAVNCSALVRAPAQNSRFTRDLRMGKCPGSVSTHASANPMGT
ncbi:hypothetical protein K503DRAFT_513216 [Rhizopogon vinicolor AM-OR11-026]|uniref:Uncharacterized protein n=1 Tax=Rhizopogon vinicolor AM-OR11-026 TaxID=1314800 RepID=A0A1B7MLW5_9AGAM|nr:hypothetical protein K503DRAFT_513216 [Rhizopogon vinicolor AM-OR11-026]